MTATALYTPAPVQQEFHNLSVDEALFGGSAGPGKSLALLMDPVDQIVLEHERCRAREIQWGRSTGMAIHFRREIPRLEETITRSKSMFSALDPKAKYDENHHKWTFSSGYRVQFAHMKDQDTFLNYRSSQVTALYFDELIEFEEEQYQQMVTRVRSTDRVLQHRLKTRAASNPAPGWVRDYFVQAAPQGRVILKRQVRLDGGEIVERSRIFLPARLSDNPDPVYRRQYEANLRDKPAHIRAALLNGDWYVVAGAFFAEEWDPNAVVVKPFRIPPTWRRFRSGDWGYKSPCVILWWAITPDDELVCYRERTFNAPGMPKKDARDVADAIRDIERANGEWDDRRNRSRLSGPMDTQLWEERGNTGPTMADDMAKAGVYWVQASKGRRFAAAQILNRLRSRGLNGRPGIMFFESCVRCRETIPALGTDPNDPEVPLKGGPDHWYDAVSYACAQHIVPASQVGSAPTNDNDDIEDELEARRSRGRYGYGGN